MRARTTETTERRPEDARRTPRGRLALAALVSVLLAASPAGCSRDTRATERADGHALERVLAADHALEAALRDVDALARTDEPKAAALLEEKALPLSDRVVEEAARAKVISPWGADRRVELEGLARARREALPRYAAALRSDDPRAKLEALEAQLELQRRAIDCSARITQALP